MLDRSSIFGKSISRILLLSRYAHAHIICTSSLYPAKEDMSFLRTHLLRYRQRLYLQYPSVMYWRQMTVKSSNKSTK